MLTDTAQVKTGLKFRNHGKIFYSKFLIGERLKPGVIKTLQKHLADNVKSRRMASDCVGVISKERCALLLAELKTYNFSKAITEGFYYVDEDRHENGEVWASSDTPIHLKSRRSFRGVRLLTVREDVFIQQEYFLFIAGILGENMEVSYSAEANNHYGIFKFTSSQGTLYCAPLKPVPKHHSTYAERLHELIEDRDREFAYGEAQNVA